MIGIRQWWRFWVILRVAWQHGLQELLGKYGRLLGPPRMRGRPRGERLRLALEELGPVFVKFGQMLATRRDILPADMAEQLVLLQDHVTPFPGETARAIVEKAYGRHIDDIFDSFTIQPLASASIAQVHAARLKPEEDEEGLEVVVKVLRPGVAGQIRRDVDLMRMLARLVEWLWPESRRFHPSAVVDEYEKIVFDELDLLREGANASQLRRNWLGSELIYHPAIMFDYTRPNVLVMERIYGVPIDRMDELRALGVDFKVLAEHGVEIFFKQVFRDNFFHADMHAGNIFVDVDDPARPRYIAVDFGIVGTLSPSDQRYLAENILAFFNRDFRRVAELHVESGWIPASTRVDEFESAIRTVCEPIFNRPLRDISFGMFLVRLFQVARRFHMEVQPQLVLLQKTLLNIEGLGRRLYPELDLWDTAKPILEEWMRNRLGPRATFGRVRDQLPELAETLPELVNVTLRRLRTQDGMQGARDAELQALREEMRRASRRTRSVVIGSTLVLSASLLLGLDGFMPLMAGPLPLLSWLLALLGVLLWLRAWRQ